MIMLISDNRFTPASMPIKTEQSAMAVMIMIRITVTVPVGSIPNTSFRPNATCCAPRPRDVVRPNNVANTARMSMA